MKRFFEQINWRVLNLSAWIVIVVTYVSPFRQMENGAARVGFPISFLTVYKEWRTNLLVSFDIDLGRLILNIAIVYLVIIVLNQLYKRFRKP